MGSVSLEKTDYTQFSEERTQISIIYRSKMKLTEVSLSKIIRPANSGGKI